MKYVNLEIFLFFQNAFVKRILERKEKFPNVAPLTWRFLCVLRHKKRLKMKRESGENMSFSKMMELLQRKNKEKIVLCNAGNFYIAVGKDAILLHELLGLKLSCLKPEVCKVGFPILSLEKYTDLIQEKKYSYIVYFFNQQKEELEILMQYENGKINRLEKSSDNCYICKGIKAYKKTDKYIMAVAKLYEKESKIEEIERKKKEKRKIWYKSKKKKTD